MDELVIPVNRANGVFGMVATTPFLLAGLAMVVGGFITASGGEDGGYVAALVGVLATLVFGYAWVRSLRTVRAPGRIRLTPDGFELYQHSFAWTDVEDFQTVRIGGDSPVTFVKVLWAPSAKQHPAIRRSAKLEKFGQSTAPSYLQVDVFDTGGPPLQEILRRWKVGDRTAGRPVEVTSEPEPTEPKLVIPRTRRGDVRALGIAGALFIGCAVGGPVLLLLEDEPHPRWWWVAGVASWLLLTAFFGVGVWYLVRDLRDPGLRLHDDGFEYQKHRWNWVDIEDIQPAQGGSDGNAPFGVRAQFRADRPLPSAPADLPFYLDSFQTGGTSIDQILREWLQRYRTRQLEDDAEA